MEHDCFAPGPVDRHPDDDLELPGRLRVRWSDEKPVHRSVVIAFQIAYVARVQKRVLASYRGTPCLAVEEVQIGATSAVYFIRLN